MPLPSPRPPSAPRPADRATLVLVLKLAGFLAVGAMALMGVCCAALLKDVPDEAPDGLAPEPRP